MDETSIEVIMGWIKEIEPSLPRPTEEINWIITNKASEESVSDEVLQFFAENLKVLNILVFSKREEEKIERSLTEIKGIINEKSSNDVGSLLQVVNEMKIELFREIELEIIAFTRDENYTDPGYQDVDNQVSKFEREIFNYLKSTPNKSLRAYMNSISQEYSVIFKTYFEDIRLMNEEERQILDFDFECINRFKIEIENKYYFTPSFLSEIFIENLIEFLHAQLLEVLYKEDIKFFLSGYKFQVSKIWYFMNSEAKLHKENSLTIFIEVIRKKYGWIPHEVERKIILKLKKETNKIWLENGFSNSEHIKEVGLFTKRQVDRILNGNLKLFQNDQQNSQEFKMAASKILWEAASKNSDSDICKWKINEISEFLDFSFYSLPHSQSPSIFTQSKENMLFFLFHTTLLTSNLHIATCPELNHYEKRESQVEDFEWLRIMVGTSFKFNPNHPTYFTRQDNPIIICGKMLEVIIDSLYKAGKLNSKTEIHQIFSESFKGYMHLIEFINAPKKESKAIKKNFTKIKEGNSAVITICISGWLSEKDNKHKDWFHVGELPNQGLTYDFKWNSGHWIDTSLKIGFNVLTWLPLPLGFRWYKLFGQGAMKPLVIGSGITSIIKRPIWTRFKDFVYLSRQDPLIPISSAVDYLVGCPFEGKAKEAANAGKLLAEIINSGEFGNSKINLICFSLAAEVVHNCLLNISAEKANTINHVILMGGASSKAGEWAKCKQNVNGRMICVYCKTDNILKYLYRASQLTEPIGLVGIDVEGVEQFDLTGTVSGHLDYREKMDEIFHAINYFGS
ncbi:unnamed protein product [Blepharisma stoltei]|uniref:Uncharacterized protein n=1 Tax=Blepharisma stoltei TaxID=1481888 RepID=A0AAU9KBB5_9CILI|nr:unnamed protein product [Blepharisma stoltei]